jgi:hypothetical protein
VLGIASAALVAALLASSGTAAPTTAPSLTLDSAKLTARWNESWLVGTLSFSGTVGDAAQLQAVLRPMGAAAQPTAVLAFAATGSFSKTLKLPARMLPGAYRLSVGGVANGARLLTETRDLVNPRPSEGIVDKAWASARAGGPPVSTVRGPRSRMWAYFHFAVPPRSGKVTVGWHSPSFRWYGRVTRPYSVTVRSSLATSPGHALERGVWFVYCFSDGKVIKRTRVRIS